MNPIETVTRSLGCVLHTPQGQHYLNQGFTDEVGPPPTEPERAYLLRALRTTADTLQANRQPVRDMLEALFVQGSPATPGVVHLVSMLSRVARICHQAGHEWPDTPDDPGRPGVEWGTMEDYFTGWAFMVSEYFPGLSIPPVVPVRATTDTPDQVADTIPADVPGATSTVEAVRVDRDRLEACFNGKFKMEDPTTKVVPCARFLDGFVAQVPTFTTTDIARVAHKVWKSKWVMQRVRHLPFAKWLREFCGMCGATVPKDTNPNKYTTPTPSMDFLAWLE